MGAADLIVEVKANLDDYKAAIDDAEAATEEFSTRGSKAMAFLEENIGTITAATAAAGAALEGFARSQAGTNETIAQIAIVTGETEDSLRKMIGGLTDSTNSSGKFVEGMDELVRQGVTTKEKMAEILPVMDDFAGATGQTIPEAIDVTKTVLGSLGIDLDDAGEHVDALTRLLRTTDTDVGTLTRNLAQVPDELQDLDFDTSDVVAGIEIMIDKGHDGEEGIREFRRLVADSDGDFDVLLDSLNVTAEEFGEYKAAVDESKGITKAFADANAAQITPIQQAQQFIANLGVEFGNFAGIAADLAPLVLAVGPAIKAVQIAMTAMKIAMTVALGPIGLITAAIAGAIAIGWALYKNWDEVTELVAGVWESIQIRAEETWNAVTEAVETFVDGVAQFFTDLKDDTVQLVIDMKDAIIEQFTGLFTGAVDSVKGLYDGVVGWFSDLKKELYDESIVPDMVDGILGEFGRMEEGSVEATMDMSTGVIHEAQGMFDNVSQIGKDLGLDWLQSAGDLVGGSIEKFLSLRETGGNLLGEFAEIGTTIGRLFAGDWTAAINLLSGDTISNIANMAGEVVDILGGLWDAVEGVVGDIGSALGSIVSKAGSVVGSVGNAIGDIVGGIADVGGDIIGGVSDFIGGIFDQGGIVTQPTLGMITAPGAGEAVIPLDQLPDMVGKLTGGGGGMNVTINQNIQGVTPNEVERQTQRALQRVAFSWQAA